MTVFSAIYACILNHPKDENMRAYATNKEQKTE